jgi:hypothetical protein
MMCGSSGPGSIDPASHAFAVTVEGLDAAFRPFGDVPHV